MEGSGSLGVREATISDFDVWFSLFDAVARERKWIGREGPLDHDAAHASFEQYVESEDRITFLVESQGRLVGLLGIETRRGLAEIGMMVDSASRGQGVGSLLMESCIAWAREHHCHNPSKSGRTTTLRSSTASSVSSRGNPASALSARERGARDAIGMGLILDWESPSSPYGS